MVADGYTAVYDSDDLPEVVIDFIVTWGVQIIAFAALIALIILWGYFRKRVK